MGDLRLDWCSHATAARAVRRWYYRPEMPRGKLAKLGVWEDGTFVGVVIFGMGSSDALGRRWGWSCFQVCELVRVALGPHVTPTSRILAIALRLLRKQSPGIKAVVSFADPAAGHDGTLYRAMGWLYAGKTAPSRRYFFRGREYHSRNVSPTGFKIRKGIRTPCPRPSQCRMIRVPGKHRYVWPLTETAREIILRTCAAGETGDTPVSQTGEGGSTPTAALCPDARPGREEHRK